MTDVAIRVARAETFTHQIFEALGAPAAHARTIARNLVAADVLGKDSHGLRQLPGYIDRVLAGGINVNPSVQTVRESSASALIDGDNGMGHVVVDRAAELAIAKARSGGTSWIGAELTR
jgi:L-2-hydroxycarboxylate dehydrogenase (NAD+)